MHVPPILCICDIQTFFGAYLAGWFFSAHINPSSRIHYNTAGVHCAILSDLDMTAHLYMSDVHTFSERSRYSETSLATERFFLVVTPYGRMNHAIYVPIIHNNMYDVLRGVLLTHRVVVFQCGSTWTCPFLSLSY